MNQMTWVLSHRWEIFSVLMKKGFIRSSDVKLSTLRAFAVHELGDGGDCECHVTDWFERALSAILATGRSHARGIALNELLMACWRLAI